MQSVVADPEVVPMDSRHRALERVARGGDPSDVARHLAERLRRGDLAVRRAIERELVTWALA